MRKKLLSIIAAVTVIAAAGVCVHAEDDISVYVDNSKVAFTDQAPAMINDRTLVPARAVFEKAGAEVTWDQPTQTATFKRGSDVVTIKYNDTFLYKNGAPIALDVPAQIINDRTMIPVRAISEAMDFGVTWNPVQKTVLVSTNGKQYRAVASLKTGFMDLKDAAEIYLNREFSNLMIDVDGDGNTEQVSFTPASEEKRAFLSINGVDCSGILPEDTQFYAFAVMDISSKDTSKQIVMVDCLGYNGAWFFQWNGSELSQIKVMDQADRSVDFVENLFFNKKGTMISDLNAVCFTNAIISGSSYDLENGGVALYRLNTDVAEGITYYKEFSDTVAYAIKYVKEFKPGTYHNLESGDSIVTSDSFSKFELVDVYVDEYDPSNIEFFIRLPQGDTAVIWPYHV